jgi:trehalose/maltose hydrolase-like predicted phosphorylase
LNFGQELNPYTSNSVSQSTASLYNDYWATYIEGLYNSQQRKTTLKATLPMSVLIDLELNQTLIIGFNKYRINAMQVDLTTGETELDLLNIIA